MNPTDTMNSSGGSRQAMKFKVSTKELRVYGVEVLGTFVLALVVILVSRGNLGILTPALAGLTLGIFVYTIGSISGAHLNPAVTLGALSIGKINLKNAIGYIIAQFIGGTLALLLTAFFSSIPVSFVQSMSGLTAVMFVAETLGAIIFTFGIASVLFGKVSQTLSGIVIGTSLLVGVFVAALAGSLGFLNPSIAFATGNINFVYALAPIVGSLIGMNLYKILRTE